MTDPTTELAATRRALHDAQTLSEQQQTQLHAAQAMLREAAQLRQALEASRTWHQAEDKALSKSGRSDTDCHWRRCQHALEIRRITDALEGGRGT